MTRNAENVRLELSGGGWLQGQFSWQVLPADFAVVFLHGFCSVRYGEKAQALEEACARRGWPFATFDFRGHGESSGTTRELTGSGLLADLDAVHGFLAARGVERLCFFGSSMGGWAAAWYALRSPRRVIANALLAPGFHILTARWDKLTPDAQAEWKRTGVLHIKNPWLEADLGFGFVQEAPHFPQEQLWREYATPTLIFQGMRDEIVPPSRTLTFLEHCAHPHLEVRLYKDGDHRLTDRKAGMAEAACEFYARWSGQIAS
jgi:alpha-beta hydrolase superfamily lysophospholipase